MKKSKKQKRKSKNKSKNQLKNRMLYTDKEYKYFLREIENLRGKNLEEIIPSINKTKIIRGGYFTNLYYGIIDWFYNVMSRITRLANSLPDTFGVKWILKFFNYFNIGDFLSIVFSLLTNIIDYLNKNVIKQIKPGFESMVKDISAYGTKSKWTWILVTVGSLGIFDYISVGTTLLNGTGIPTWILTNINSNLNPFNFIWNVICTVGNVLGTSIVTSIQTIWNISNIGPLLATLLILLPFLLLGLAYDITSVEEDNEYYKQRNKKIGNKYKTHEEAIRGVEEEADKKRTSFYESYINKIREIAETAVKNFKFPPRDHNRDEWIQQQVEIAVSAAVAAPNPEKIPVDVIRTTAETAIRNFHPLKPIPAPARFNQDKYTTDQAKAAGNAAVVERDAAASAAADNAKMEFIRNNSPIHTIHGGKKSLRNISQEKIEEANEKYPTNFIMAQLAGLIKENEKGEYYYTEQADKAMDIMKKDIDRIITDNCSGENCEQTSMIEKIEAILFVHTASVHASIRKHTESNGGGSQKEEFDMNVLNHLKEEDIKWIQEQHPDQIKSAQRLGLLDGLKPTKKCDGILKSSQTINGIKLS